MEVTAAAAQAATYTNSKSLAEQINDYLAATKTSIATLASEIPGYSRPTISRYLSGKYEGDIAAIEKLLADNRQALSVIFTKAAHVALLFNLFV